jgi:hypothetical protein
LRRPPSSNSRVDTAQSSRGAIVVVVIGARRDPAVELSRSSESSGTKTMTRARTTPLASCGRLRGTCGAHYSGVIRSDGHTRHYRCTGRRKEEPCSCPNLAAPLVEDKAWAVVVDLLLDPACLRQLVGDFLAKQLPAGQHEADQITTIEKKIEKYDTMIEGSLVNYAKAGIHPDRVAKALEAVTAERDALAARLERLKTWRDHSDALHQ